LKGVSEFGDAYPSIELAETLKGEVVDVHQGGGNPEQRAISESVWASLDFQSYSRYSSIPKDVKQCSRTSQSFRADSAVHFLDNLAWRAEESSPITSCTFDDAIRAVNHSAELTHLQGARSVSSPNSCAVCGGSSTPGLDLPLVNKADGEGKPAKA
jgi:hypothetical protein